MSLADELLGVVYTSRLPRGGVKRIERRATVEEVTPAQLRREKRREAHTRYMERSGYREKNREKIAEQMRAWRARNPDRVRAYRDKWKAANPVKAKLAAKRFRSTYRARNAEKTAAYDRKYQREHRAQINANKKRWYAENRDAINARRRAARRAKCP